MPAFLFLDSVFLIPPLQQAYLCTCIWPPPQTKKKPSKILILITNLYPHQQNFWNFFHGPKSCAGGEPCIAFQNASFRPASLYTITPRRLLILESLGGVYEERLIQNILHGRNYSNLARPIEDESLSLQVTFDLSLQQIVTVVRNDSTCACACALAAWSLTTSFFFFFSFSVA